MNTDQPTNLQTAAEDDLPVRGTARRRRLVRSTLAAIVLVAGMAALFVSPANADVGGCYYNCAGDYRLSTPATFTGVQTRADRGSISISLDRGYRGSVHVQAWVWSWNANRYVASADTWLGDNYSMSYLGTAASLVPMYPGTRGAHSVYVKLSSADGYVVMNGWSNLYSNYYWNSATGSYSWTSGTYAWL